MTTSVRLGRQGLTGGVRAPLAAPAPRLLARGCKLPGAAFPAPFPEERSHWPVHQFQSPATRSQSCHPSRHSKTSLLSQHFVLLIKKGLGINPCPHNQEPQSLAHSLSGSTHVHSVVLLWSFIRSELLCQALIQMPPLPSHPVTDG